MKYTKLEGICRQAIAKNKCLGCQKLEDINFKGVDKCSYMKEDFGIQEKIKFEED